MSTFIRVVLIIIITRSDQRAHTSAERQHTCNRVNPDFGLRTPGFERWSGSSPKLNSLVPGPCPTPPRNFVKIRSQLFQLSDGQTDRQTDRSENRTSFRGGNNNRRFTCGDAMCSHSHTLVKPTDPDGWTSSATQSKIKDHTADFLYCNQCRRDSPRAKHVPEPAWKRSIAVSPVLR